MKAATFLVLTAVMISLPAFSQDVPAECKSPPSCDEASICISRPPRDCTLARDNRECGRNINLGFTKIHTNDPACEAAKASQNAAYSAAKAACEAQKSSEDAMQKQNCLSAIQACKAISKACADLAK
jgi:hypothetical protein